MAKGHEGRKRPRSYEEKLMCLGVEMKISSLIAATIRDKSLALSHIWSQVEIFHKVNSAF